MKTLTRTLMACVMAACAWGAIAQEATIRKVLSERLPKNIRIDEISKTPMNGLYEVRYNQTEIIYSDATGSFILQGNLIDTRTREDLTDKRVEKLTAIDFKSLPFKDAFTVVRGNGQRKLAVFEDPNCGYCKKFERDLTQVDDVTVYVFLYPILSPDSAEKSRNIWCAKDKGKAFMDWMTKDVTPPAATCDTSALERNIELGKKSRVTGTPTLVFTNGARVPGAVGADRVEKMLADAQ